MFLGPATLVVAIGVLAVAAVGIALLLSGARRGRSTNQTCPTPGCTQRNRPGAEFCASCGRKLK
jgi:hypothetical protein